MIIIIVFLLLNVCDSSTLQFTLLLIQTVAKGLQYSWNRLILYPVYKLIYLHYTLWDFFRDCVSWIDS